VVTPLEERVVEVVERLRAVGPHRGEQASAADAGDNLNLREHVSVMQRTKRTQAERRRPKPAAGKTLTQPSAGPSYS